MDRMDAHTASLRTFDTTQFAQAAALHLRAQRGNSANEAAAMSNLSARAYSLIRPHPVARRYAELAASLHTIGCAANGAMFSDKIGIFSHDFTICSSRY